MCTNRTTPYLSVFSPNAGKYGPGKSEYEHFRAVYAKNIIKQLQFQVSCTVRKSSTDIAKAF